MFGLDDPTCNRLVGSPVVSPKSRLSLSQSSGIPIGHRRPGQPQHQPVRHCFHVGSSSGFRESLGDLGDKNEVSASDMIKGMMAYVWPKDDALTRKR